MFSPLSRTWRYAAIVAILLTAVLYLGGPWTVPERPETLKLNMANSHPQDIGMAHLANSSFNWAALPRRWPVESLRPLPSGRPRLQRRVQAGARETGSAYADKLELHRQEVRIAFLKGWNGYRKYAWMRDELGPVSATGRDTLGGWAATLIENLDTLWIMDLKEEFVDAVEAVAAMDWANTTATGCDLFETTTRHLGGLLAAYDLSGAEVLLIKATELGDMLYAAFDTPNHLPTSWLDFEKAKKGELVADEHQPSISAGALSLEFTRLSQLTENPKYYDAITRVTALLEESQNQTRIPGIWPATLNTRDGNFRDGDDFTIGASAGSMYEYLPKMHALLGNLDPVYETLANHSLEAIRDHILFRPMLPGRDGILFSGNAHVEEDGNITRVPEMQHANCFAGAMFGLGGRILRRDDFVDIGVQLTWGCLHAFNAFPTGVAPELFSMFECPTLDFCDWDEERWQSQGNKSLREGFRHVQDPSYRLRPEAIESTFVLYRITGLRGYSDVLYETFLAVQKATDSRFGNAAILDVRVPGVPTRRDSMDVSSPPPNPSLVDR